MGWYQNNTSYQPDSSLAKMMSGGGLGGFLSNLGGAMKQTTTDMYARDDIEAKRKLEQDTLALTKQHYADTGSYYKANADNLAFNQNQKLNEQADAYNTKRSEVLAQKPNIGLPAYGEIPSDPTAQSQIKGQVNSLYNGILEEKAKKDLLSQRAFEMAKIAAQKSTPTQDANPYKVGAFLDALDGSGNPIKGMVVGFNKETNLPIISNGRNIINDWSLPTGAQAQEAKVPVTTKITTGDGRAIDVQPLGNGNYFDGTRIYKVGEYTLGSDANAINTTPFNASTDRIDTKSTIDEMNRVRSESASGLVGSVGSALRNNPVSGYVMPDDFSTYQDTIASEYKKMKDNPSNKYISNKQILDTVTSKVGMQYSPLTGSYTFTDKQKVKNFLTSNLMAGDDTVSTKELVSAGIAKNEDEASKIKQFAVSNAREQAKENASLKSIVDKNGLDDGSIVRFYNQAKLNGVGVFATLEKVANAVDTRRANAEGDNPNAMQDLYKELEHKSNNWSKANQTTDVAKLTSDLTAYIMPTLGLDLAAAKTISGAIVKNSIKLGSIDAGITAMLNRPSDEVLNNAMYGAVGGGSVGGAFKTGQASFSKAGQYANDILNSFKSKP